MPSEAELIARAVGLHQTTPEILAACAQVSREILGADATFAALAGPAGAYPMSVTDGIRDLRFREITVRPGTGLGGQVLLRRRPHRVAEYLHDPTISRDFVHVVCELEGLHGMACVPVHGPDRIEALLYTGTRAAAPPADATVSMLELAAAQAELALHQAAARRQETELAMLRDRQRLATQLHDSVAQMLFTIGVAAHYARRQGDPAALTAALEEIEATAAQARSELRASLHRLSQPADGLAFEARLAGEARLFERTTGCRVTITKRGERRDIPQPVEDLLIDTALEGLRNAVKHARAQVAILHLAYRVDEVTLVLQAGTQAAALAHPGDSPVLPGGSPVRPGEHPVHPGDHPARHGKHPVHPGGGGRAGTGGGLALLRHRAAQLRGTLELTSDSAGHTVLRVELPTRLFPGSPP